MRFLCHNFALMPTLKVIGASHDLLQCSSIHLKKGLSTKFRSVDGTITVPYVYRGI
jgi:hypothetical protein